MTEIADLLIYKKLSQRGTAMSEISIQIGNRIRTFRKKRKMTLDDLSDRIHKIYIIFAVRQNHGLFHG